MTRPVTTVLLLVGLFGVLVPYYKRYDFLDPVLLAAYFCLPLVLVAPVAANALAGSAGSVADTVTRCLQVSLYGWGLGLAIVAAGLITVNASAWHGHMLLPRGTFLGAGVFVSATAALASAIAAGLFAHLSSARMAKTILRIVFLIVLIVLVLLVRGVSPSWSNAFWQHTTSAELTRIGVWLGAALAVTDAVALATFARLRRIH